MGGDGAGLALSLALLALLGSAQLATESGTNLGPEGHSAG